MNELARHYAIPNVCGSQFRRVTASPTRIARAARPGQLLDGDVARRPDDRGRARQVDSRQHSGRAAAAAAARRSAAQGKREQRQGAVAACADGTSREPDVRRCHARMDRWASPSRTSMPVNGAPRKRQSVDASAALPDGTKFGPVRLRARGFSASRNSLSARSPRSWSFTGWVEASSTDAPANPEDRS